MTMPGRAGPPQITRRCSLAGLAAALLGARPAAAEIVDFVVVGKDDWLFAIYDEARRMDVARMRSVTGTINDAVAILKRAGITTAIALSPAKSRIYRDELPADFQFTPEVEKRYAVALDMLSKPGTLVPDLARTMLDLRKAHPDVAYFLKADTHWTGEGAEACAAEMATQIKAKLPLPPSASPGTALGPPVAMKQGANDLAEGLPDDRATRYGPQTYHIHQVAVAPGAGLLDDDAADVLLVGNSYMQPKYGFSPMLSNQLGRPVALVWKVHQSSPYKTLLGALAGAGKQRPKLLIWDFEETDMLALADEAGVWGPNVLKPEAFLAQLRGVVGA